MQSYTPACLEIDANIYQQYSDQGIAITACPVGMSPCAQNGTCPDIKVPILADPYSLEWWHSACNAQWLYQHRHVPVDMPTHHTNKDPQSSALKTDLYPNQVMMSCRSAYSVCHRWLSSNRPLTVWL